MTAAVKKIEELEYLVVDDHIIERSTLKRILQSIGCRSVAEASDAREASEKMARCRYDVVFLDWNMPGETGLELLRKYREDKSYDSTAFVMFSAESGNRFLIDALRAGATSYIVKPADDAVVREHINEVLKWIYQQKELSR